MMKMQIVIATTSVVRETMISPSLRVAQVNGVAMLDVASFDLAAEMAGILVIRYRIGWDDDLGEGAATQTVTKRSVAQR